MFFITSKLKKNNYIKYFVGLSNNCEIEISKTLKYIHKLHVF